MFPTFGKLRRAISNPWKRFRYGLARKTQMKTKHGGLTRRKFLTAAATAPLVVRAATLGRGGATPPSERLVLAVIGVGGRGRHDLGAVLSEKDAQVVAVCDVARERREFAKVKVDEQYGNKACVMLTDFREALARADVDAIVMAPGDRWHTPMAVLAMRAGKDVFSEKPSTMSIAEGRVLAATARQLGRVFQTGTQRRSEPDFVFADELARSGRLGQLHTLFAHTLPFEMKHDLLPAQPEPAKSDLDWELWLGPAPWRPYNKGYTTGCGAWLDYYDFGTGVAGWCSHTICQCQGVIGADLTSAVEYEFPNNATSEGFTARYANGVKLVLGVGNFKDFGRWHGSCGVRYEGSEGWVACADGYAGPEVSNPALLGERQKLLLAYQQRERRVLSHIRDFLDCVRARRQPVANAEVAHRSMTTCHAINLAMLLKRNLKFDPAKEEFIGDAEANRLRSRATRTPWQV
jgi:predicted dehydrogenase